jgi:hypothetical protein
MSRTRGDRESALRWICKSTRSIVEGLGEQDHPVSHIKVAQILHVVNYSLQGNRKAEEGAEYPDRDAQLRHINATDKRCLGEGAPSFRSIPRRKNFWAITQCGQQWLAAKHSLRV